jgi:hypothetical protein
VTKVDLDRLRGLLATHSVEPTSWWRLRSGETGALLDEVRALAGDVDPRTRRHTWAALEQVVDDGNRDNFFALLVDDLDTEQFRRLLTDTDPEVRIRARWMDTTGFQKDPFAMMALDLLADERFDYAWPDCMEVLRRPARFDTLVDALAEAPRAGPGERLMVTVGLPAGTRLPEFPPEQAPSTVACWRCDCELMAAHRCRHLPVFVALLGSSLDWVREFAVSALCECGPGVTGSLESMRRRSDFAARRQALVLLAEFGWNRIPAEDLRVLQRLIQMKQKTETPQPLNYEYLDGSWYALPTTDQAAVIDAFDLCDPIPVTMRMGFAPWQGRAPLPVYAEGWANMDGDFWAENSRLYERYPYPEVFITPVLDGWTLVFYRDHALGGISGSPSVEGQDETYQRVEELSIRFGSAHWYEQFGDDYEPGCRSQWCVARDGEVLMHCVSAGDVRIRRSGEIDQTASLDRLYQWLEANDNGRGPRPSRAEAERVEGYVKMLCEHSDMGLLRDDDAEPGSDMASPLQDQVFGARAAAQRLSVGLETLGPQTRVQGTGVMAVPAHLRHCLRRGALPI